MKHITYNGETHTLKEWITILELAEATHLDSDLVDFSQELDFEGRITNDNLYKLYVIWSGEKCLPQTVFAKRIALVFKIHRPDLVRFRTMNQRGWERSVI